MCIRDSLEDLAGFTQERHEVLLDYRDDLGTVDSVNTRIAELESLSESGETQGWTEVERRDHRALLEREHRKLTRISKLESIESFTYTIRSWSIGEIVLLGLNGELYNCYQTRVREAVGDRAVVVLSLIHISEPTRPY